MTVLACLTDAGVRVELDAGDLIVEPRAPLTDDQITYLREHKKELVEQLKSQRRRRRDEVLMLLADNPGIHYAYVADADSDPIIIAVGIRDLATFEMTIPTDRYDPFAILHLFEPEL